MRKSIIIQLTLGLTLSIAAGFLIFNWMGNTRQEQAAQIPQKTKIIVAAQTIEKGTKITKSHLKLADFLPSSIPEGSYRESDDLLGRIVSSNVGKGEPLTRSRLVSDEIQFGGVSTLIAPGKRAIAVKGNEVLGIAGFIRPGNHVDVLVTIDDERLKGDPSVTKTVLENIRVLATGTELEQDGDDNSTSNVDIYTLEIEPDQAEKLMLAATRGTLHFSLRNPADADSVKTKGTTVPDTLGTMRAERPAQKTASKAYVPVRSVEVISGTDRKKMRF